MGLVSQGPAAPSPALQPQGQSVLPPAGQGRLLHPHPLQGLEFPHSLSLVWAGLTFPRLHPVLGWAVLPTGDGGCSLPESGGIEGQLVNPGPGAQDKRRVEGGSGARAARGSWHLTEGCTRSEGPTWLAP